MSSYLLVSEFDPLEAEPVVCRFAQQLCGQGHKVELFLVHNSVLAARKSFKNKRLTQLLEAGVQIKVDSYAAELRGLNQPELVNGAEVVPIDYVSDAMASGIKVSWV